LVSPEELVHRPSADRQAFYDFGDLVEPWPRLLWNVDLTLRDEVAHVL